MERKKESEEQLFVEYYRIRRSLEYLDHYSRERHWQRLHEALRRRRMRRWLGYGGSVVAAIAVVVSVFNLWRRTEGTVPVSQVADRREIVQVAKPTGVVLSLADGRQVNLSAADGEIPVIPGAVNHVESRQLVYTDAETSTETMQLNRLEVPQGCEYHLMLSDGTKVWVNASTELQYPVAFGATREVHLRGEAYFEVAPDAARPFIVRTEGAAVRVLGTEFNVNSRKGNRVQAVLVSGKVEMETGAGCKTLLRPGEMGEAVGSAIHVTEVNVRKYTAWRQGEFYFEDATLEEIMQELGEWYGKQVVFTNSSARSRRFSGILKRSESIETVLRKVEQTTNVHFGIQAEMVTVK